MRTHGHTYTVAHTHVHAAATQRHIPSDVCTTPAGTHTHTHYAHSLRRQCKVYLLCGDDYGDGLGELELAHSFMKGKHMERRTVGRGEEKHFYYLDQHLLAESTPKHTKLNHLVSMKSKCPVIIHIPCLLVPPLNTLETAQNQKTGSQQI